MNPTGRVTVTTETSTVSRFKLLGFGDDPRVVNEGDLLMISEMFLNEEGKSEKVSLEVMLRGKDLYLFSEKLAASISLYESNKEYLERPASKVITPIERASFPARRRAMARREARAALEAATPRGERKLSPPPSLRRTSDLLDESRG